MLVASQALVAERLTTVCTLSQLRLLMALVGVTVVYQTSSVQSHKSTTSTPKGHLLDFMSVLLVVLLSLLLLLQLILLIHKLRFLL